MDQPTQIEVCSPQRGESRLLGDRRAGKAEHSLIVPGLTKLERLLRDRDRQSDTVVARARAPGHRIATTVVGSTAALGFERLEEPANESVLVFDGEVTREPACRQRLLERARLEQQRVGAIDFVLLAECVQLEPVLKRGLLASHRQAERFQILLQRGDGHQAG